jgi:hypothetical protein
MKWIACKDRMPKDGEDVIFLAFGVDILVGFFSESMQEWCIHYANETYPRKNQVTHWMPLPELPTNTQ